MKTVDDGGRALSALLLDLYQRSNELGYREFLRFAFRRVSELVRIDSGLFAAGRIENGVPIAHDALLHEKPPEFMETWEKIKHQDFVAAHALTNPGITGNFDLADPTFDGCDDARRYWREWGLAHVLCTSSLDRTAGLYWVLCLNRSNPQEPYSERDRAAIELAMPHLLAAARQARVAQMRSVSRVANVHGHFAAVIGADERVIDADPGFIELLRMEWNEWTGPVLPRELGDVVRRATGQPVVRRKIVVRADAASGLRLVHARRVTIADQLTVREREIAEAFSQGETHREISERFGIAPNTVRRHLTNIYEKLGISSKVELSRMLT